MTEVSADWVLPVDGPPIAGGRVALRGRRDRRGRARTRGDALRGRGDRPGLRQRPLAPRVLAATQASATASRSGRGSRPMPRARTSSTTRTCSRSPGSASLDSLRSGITTTADYSFSGAAATAAAELGLRAIVYLEVFAQDPALAAQQFAGEARPDRGVAARADRRLAARSVHVLARRLRVVPVARHPGRHPSRRVGERERLARATATGPWEGIAPLLVPPTGRRAVATLEPVLGPDLLCAHCVEVDEQRDRAPRRARRAGRPLPPVERPARLRRRAAGRAARRRRHGRARDGLARLDALLRRVRGDAGRDLRRPGPGAAPRGAPRGRGAAPSRRRMRPALCEWTTRWVP